MSREMRVLLWLLPVLVLVLVLLTPAVLVLLLAKRYEVVDRIQLFSAFPFFVQFVVV